MKMVDRESTKLPTKTPKMATTSPLSRTFVFERKWGLDKIVTFGQNPCLFGENGYRGVRLKGPFTLMCIKTLDFPKVSLAN